MCKWKTAILAISTCIISGGCGNFATYRQTAADGVLVEANVDAYYSNGYTKTSLNKDWLENYLITLTDSSGKPLFEESKLKPLIPDIQQALAEWGNVVVRRCFTDSRTWYAGFWIFGNSIRGDTYSETWLYGNKTRIEGKIEPRQIPQSGYVSD